MGSGRTCDSFAAVHDREHGEGIPRKRTVLRRGNVAVRRPSFGMFVPRLFSQAAKDITETQSGDHVQRTDFETKPGERCQRRQRIPIERDERLEAHDG